MNRLLCLAALALLAAPALRAQSFQGLGHLDPSTPVSYAYDVSADGSVVVGYSQAPSGVGTTTGSAYRWEGAMQALPYTYPQYPYGNSALGVSADGTAVVGWSAGAVVGQQTAATRWVGGGAQDVGPPFISQATAASADGSVVVGGVSTRTFRFANGTPEVITIGTQSTAYDVSADGEVMVGYAYAPSTRAYRWEDGVVTFLPDFPDDPGEVTTAYAISADGSVIVGSARRNQETRMTRWVDGVIEDLGLGTAYGVSAGGNLVVGHNNGVGDALRAVIWTPDGGVQDLRTFLVDTYGLDLAGWTLQRANAVSDDGTTIVGDGINPAGRLEAWRAVLAPAGLTYTINARPDEVEVGDTITVAVVATNGGSVPLTDVRPDGPMEVEADDGIEVTPLTGPEPTTLPQLGPAETDSLVYTYLVASGGRSPGRARGGGREVSFEVGVEGTDPGGAPVEGTNVCATPPCGTVTVTVGLLVNSVEDGADEDAEDGMCDTGQEIEIDGEMVPECTLRAALMEANAAADRDEIAFDIPGGGLHTIRPASSLPPFEHAVVLDATTQPGYDGTPLVFLDGSDDIDEADGLHLEPEAQGAPGPFGASVVRGLAIGNFEGHGIWIQGAGAVLQGGSHLIERNYIGTDASGTQGAGNGRHGVFIDNSLGNTIRLNLVSGNDSTGVYDDGASNVIVGNRIGTDAPGTGALGNGAHGVYHQAPGELEPSRIGAPGAANLISGNGGSGVVVRGGVTLIQNNYIGTDLAGQAALPNGEGGILGQGTGAVISDNLISGNTAFGLLLGAFGDDQESASESEVRANRIGTNAEGTRALPNAGPGVWLTNGAAGNKVGVPGQPSNLISGNAGDGVLVTNLLGGGALIRRDNRIAGNLIGTDVTGARRLPNQGAGVHVRYDNTEVNSEPTSDLIGGGSAEGGWGLPEGTAPQNVIAGNLGPGVRVERVCNGCGVDVRVEGNFIGTDLTGGQVLGNGGAGVLIEEGGDAFVTRNLVSGNAEGVVVRGEDGLSGVVRNLIGGDLTARTPLGNLGDGVVVSGTAVVNANTIVGNGAHGVAVSAGEEGRAEVYGNRIGFAVASDGTLVPMGNALDGVYLGPGAEGAQVLPGNTIAYNGGAGISVFGGEGHHLRRNLIFANGGLPIDLGGDGATLNDPGDGDDGPNERANYPVVETAWLADGELFVGGYLSGERNTFYDADLFVDGPDVEGFGAAQGHLTNVSARTPLLADEGLFRVPFTARMALSASIPSADYTDFNAGPVQLVEVGWTLRALATEPDGGRNGQTSEFSPGVLIEPAPETEEAAAGDDRLPMGGDGVRSSAGFRGADSFRGGTPFAPGDTLLVCPGCANEETVTVAAVEGTALVLTAPLARAHAAGEAVVPAARARAALLVTADTTAAFGGGTATTVTFAGVTGGGTVTVERLRRAPATTEGITHETVLPHRWTAALDSTLAFSATTELRIALAGVPGLTLEAPEGVVVYHRPVPGQGAFTPLVTTFDTTAAAFVARGFTALGEFALATDEEVDTGEEPEVPEAFALSAATPNPFTTSATLDLDLPTAGTVEVTVYDALGRRVAVLLDGELEAGTHRVRFEASGLPSGVYLVRAVTAEGAQTRSVTLVR